ncbi:MAG: WD40 repeat domain-containing protein [Planctomyces sp.]
MDSEKVILVAGVSSRASKSCAVSFRRPGLNWSWRRFSSLVGIVCILFSALLLTPAAVSGNDTIVEFSGLIPEPLPIPEIGKWQLITKSPQGVLRSAVWSPDESLFAVCEANHVRIYDASSLKLLKVLVGHSLPVRSVAWHPDGSQLASCSEDGTVRLWTSSGKPIHTISAHPGVVYQIAWHPSGQQLASCSSDGNVGIWDAKGNQIRMIREGDRHVFALDWSPNGKMLATVGGDIAPVTEFISGLAAVRVWDASDGKLIQTIGLDEEYAALCVDWDVESKLLAVGYGESYRSLQEAYAPIQGAGIRIWTIDGELEEEVETQVGSVSAVAWDPAGKRIAFGGRHADLWVRESESGNAFKRPSATRDMNSVCWSRDGKRLLGTGRQAVVELTARDLTNGAAQFTQQLLGLANRQFTYVNWSPDGTQLAGETYTGLHFWKSDGTIINETEVSDHSSKWWEHSRNPVSSDGKVAALKGDVPRMREWARSSQNWFAGGTWRDSSVRIWDDQGAQVSLIRKHRGGVESVSWKPDGEWLVSGGGDSVRIWKKDGTPGAVMTGHTDEVYRVAWSPDGEWIASGATDSLIRFWKMDGTAGPVFRGHVAGIHDLAWSPDSTRLASASWLDSTVRVWDFKSGRTKWLAIQLTPRQVAVFDSAGKPISQDTDLLHEHLMCIIQTPDGTCELMEYKDFRTKSAEAFKAQNSR